jgi:hypothetical protein
MQARLAAVSTSVRGVDFESGALSARTQDEAAAGTAARTRTPRAASLADRTAQRLVVAALGAGTQSVWADRPSRRGGVPVRYGIAILVDVKASK